MTDQEKLSTAYESLKSRYWIIKRLLPIDWEQVQKDNSKLYDKCIYQGNSIIVLEDENKEYRAEIEKLKKEVREVKNRPALPDTILVIHDAKEIGSYVSQSRYLVALTKAKEWEKKYKESITIKTEQ